MRALLIILAVVLFLLQLRLWQEYRDVRALRELVAVQLEENKELRSRNEELAAEVEDLRAGLEAVEERARSELGLIREDEEFYMIVRPEDIEPEQ